MISEKRNIYIQTDYIKLESAMKLANMVTSGGMAKEEIQGGKVSVNGEVCTARGKKLYPHDIFEYEDICCMICAHGY